MNIKVEEETRWKWIPWKVYKIVDGLYLYLVGGDRSPITRTDVFDFSGKMINQDGEYHLRFTPEGEPVSLKVDLNEKDKNVTVYCSGSPCFSESIPGYGYSKFIFNNKRELFVMGYPNTYPGYFISEDKGKISVDGPSNTRQPFCFLDTYKLLFSVNTKYRTYHIDDGRTYPADIHFVAAELKRGGEK